MTSKITKQHVIDEWHNLADLLTSLSEEEWNKPSACEGWSVAQLSSHLFLVSGPPWIMLWGAFWTILTRQSFNKWMEGYLAKINKKGSHQLVAALRKRKMPVIAQLGLMGRMMMYAEAVVHQEDIRRPLGKSRLTAPNPEAIWGLIPTWSKQFKQLKNKGNVLLQASDKRELMYQVGGENKPKLLEDIRPGYVLIRGEPLEVLLFIMGRPANVTIGGEGPLAEDFRTIPLKL